MPPPSGYRTFNQFCARHMEPGCLPIAELNNPSVVVSPVDASFIGQWPIFADSTIEVALGGPTLSKYRDRGDALTLSNGSATSSCRRADW